MEDKFFGFRLWDQFSWISLSKAARANSDEFVGEKIVTIEEEEDSSFSPINEAGIGEEEVPVTAEALRREMLCVPLEFSIEEVDDEEDSSFGEGNIVPLPIEEVPLTADALRRAALRVLMGYTASIEDGDQQT